MKIKQIRFFSMMLIIFFIISTLNTNYVEEKSKRGKLLLTYNISNVQAEEVGIDASSSIVVLSKSKFYYDGKKHKPKVTVKLGGNVLSTKYYTVKYSDNVSVYCGIYSVEVVFKNGYYGCIEKKYQIVNQVKDFELMGFSKSFGYSVIKMYNNESIYYKDKEIGLLIQYSTSKKFVSKKTKTIKVTPKKYYKLMSPSNSKGIKDVSMRSSTGEFLGYGRRYALVNKLKGNKKYYVRIKLYQKDLNSTEYLYSDWSKVKSVKTK